MNYRFVAVIVSAIVAGASIAGAASAQQRGQGPGAPVKGPTAKDLYVSNCQMCHGPDGKATIPNMSFVGRKWKTKTHTEAVKTIKEGVPGTVMMPFKGKLTDAQINTLARYVRSLDKPAPRPKK